MDLQTIFYTLGIIFMSLMIFIMLAIVFLLFFIKNMITKLQRDIEEKIHEITSQPATVAANIGAAVASSAIKGIKSFVKRKK